MPMSEIEMTLCKPYSRDGEVKGIKVSFTAIYETQTQALKFLHELNELVARYVDNKEVL